MRAALHLTYKCRDSSIGNKNLRKKLLLMIKHKSVAQVKLTLEGVNYRHSTEGKGATLLHCSATYGNLEIAKYLIARGLNVNAQDLMGRTPLMKAVVEGHSEVVQFLLAAGADIDILNNENKSVVDVFSYHHTNSRTICQLLLEALRTKCYSSEELAKRLVDAGYQLHQAVFLKDSRIIECMIEQGSAIDSVNPLRGYTALHEAFEYVDVKIVKLLVKHGADVKALDFDGKIPLWYLYYRKEKDNKDSEKVEILQFLSDQGILFKFTSPEDLSQLRIVLISGDREAVKVILRSTVDYKVHDTFRRESMLHHLAMNMNPGIVEVVKPFVHKFNLDAINIGGSSPLAEACFFGNVDMLKLLLDEGASMDAFDDLPHRVPLHGVYLGKIVQRTVQYDECAEILFEHGADPQTIGIKRDGQRVTIIDSAMDQGSFHFDRIKMAIARLVILEMQGTTIIELVRSKIDSRKSFREYFSHCRQILEKEIVKSVTVFKLLTEDDEQMMRYLRNEKLVRKLMRIEYKNDLKLSCAYISKCLQKRISKKFYKMRMLNHAALFVCDIFEGRVNKCNLIVEKIVDHFDDETLYCIGEI